MLANVSTQLVVAQCWYVCAMLIDGTDRPVAVAAAAAAVLRAVTLETRCKQR